MRRFIDRVDELRALNEAWSSGDAELVIVHGRRRVGKSALLARFASSKPVSYYVAAQQLERDQLADLGRVLGRLSTGSRQGRPPALALSDWDAMLDTLTDAAQARRVGLILDEFPYLVDSNSALPSLLQRWWDQVGSRSNLVLVLSGSQQEMMRRLVSSDGALYGRPTRRLPIRPLDYYHAGQFVSKWSPEDKVRAYSVAGGVPDYLEEFDDARSLRDELLRLAFSPEGRFFREAGDLLRAEFNEPRTYESVLRAIAQGEVTPGSIADQAGLKGANRVVPYLERLIELDLVERRVLPTDISIAKPRISQYVLLDPYLRFYFAIIDPWRSAIQVGQGEQVLSELWGTEFDHFVSRAFEDIARQYLRRLSAIGRLPPVSGIGFWWFRGGDVDVVATARNRVIAAGSAKWSNQFFKPADLSDLRRDVETIAPGVHPELFLFSRSGFDANLPRDERIHRVGLRALYRAELDRRRPIGTEGTAG